MSVRITCPGCKASYPVDDDLRGKRIFCKQCEHPIPVPARKKDDEGVFDPKGKSAPVPSRRTSRDEDSARPASRRDRDDSDAPRPAKQSKSGLLAVLLVAGGGLAVLGVVCIGLVVVLYFRLRAEPVAQIAVAQNNEPPPIFQMKMPPPPPPGDQQPVFNPPDNNPPVGNPNPPAGGQIDAATRDKVKQATVYLHVTMPNGDQASGSGFFAIEPGIVITNAHVLGMLQAQSRPPNNVDVVLNSGQPGEMTLRGTVLGVDRDTDLAVVRVAGNGLPAPLPVHTATSLSELQDAYFFGFPFGKKLGTEISINEAKVSSLRKDPATGAIAMVQLTGDMQPGNSGGPVVDSAGRVVAIAVAIIKDTRINFAVPADKIKPILDGRLDESTYGEPFAENNQIKLPAKFECLDPLGRVQTLRIEVWAGNRGPARPSSYQQPQGVPGDGPRQSVTINYQNGRAVGDIPLPSVPAGQVYWIQPVVVNGAGVTQWSPAVVREPAPPLQRVAADLQMKLDQPGQRTLKMINEMRVTLMEGKNRASKILKIDADVLETITPEEKGTGIRLTIGPNEFTNIDEFDGKMGKFPLNLTKRLRDLSPTFLADRTGNLLSRGIPGVNQKLAEKDDLEFMLGRICNVFEETCLGLPNKMVNPNETWSAKIPKMMPGKDKFKKRMVDLHLTCTYEGTRLNNDRHEAFITLAGIVKAREKNDPAPVGKVTGRALVDLDRGFIAQINSGRWSTRWTSAARRWP